MGNPDPVFVNSGVISFGGTLNINSSQNSMGRLDLSTNGTINLQASSLVVRFANSSGLLWDATSRMVIAGWNGSYSGNGTNQIYFGNTSGGLTAAQVLKIRFLNPVGSQPGYYHARILSTGEIVPAPAVLQSSRSSNQLVLTWTGGYQLSTATNALGPYQLVVGATSPYTNDMRTSLQRFFMLNRFN